MPDSTDQYGAGIDPNAIDWSALSNVFGGLSGAQGNSVGPVSFDPSVWSGGVQYRSDLTGGGSEGRQFAEVSPQEREMMALLEAQNQSGLANAKKENEQWAQENPELATAVAPLTQANKERTEKEAAEDKESEPIRKKLSQYLQNNQFDEAFKYAQANEGMKYLMDADSLKNLRAPFTKEETSAFMQAIPSDYAGKGYIYDPSVGAQLSTARWGGEGTAATGYPDPTQAFKKPDDMEAAKKILIMVGTGMLTAGFAPAIFGAGGIGGGLSAAEAAAVKAAAGNMISTALQGGDIGDVLKAGATAGVTAGLSSFAAPALNNALSSAGLPESLAKAATNAAVSAGTAAARGQDPLQAGVISGFGTYVSLEGKTAAEAFAEKTGISAELAKQLVGPAGSALATSIVGGNALAAAANEYVNENSQKLLDAGKEKFKDLFPETSKTIGNFVDQVKDYGKEFTDSLKNLTSGSTPSAGALPSVESPLEEVGVTAKRLPIPIDVALNPFTPTVDIPEPVGALPPVEPELEEVGVTAKKLPETPINAISTQSPLSTVTPVEPPPVQDDLAEVEVTAKKLPETPINVVSNEPPKNEATVGDDGMEEIGVTATKPKAPLDTLALNPFTPTVDIPEPTLNLPSNIGITVKKPSTGGLDFDSGASGSQSPWLDTSDQFLKSKASNQGGTKLAELKQIFGQLDPSLQGVLADRGYGAAPVASGGLIQAYADGGSTCCFKAILKDLAPNFAPCTQEMLAPLMARKPIPTTLAKLAHIKPYIAPTGGMGGMAKGGLPSKYAEAAPEGHNPEFITGLTGYYAQGGGTGQSDDIPAMLHDGDYVMDADTVAAFGDGSSKAGAEVLEHLREQVPHQSGGQGKAVPAKIADGEYVFPAAFVTALGGGDNKQGSKILDEMRERLRAHKRSAPTSKIPPKAKSPLDYLRKG